MHTEFLELLRFEEWGANQLCEWVRAHPGHDELNEMLASLRVRYQAALERFGLAPLPDESPASCQDWIAPVMDSLDAFIRSQPSDAFENDLSNDLWRLFHEAEQQRERMIEKIEARTGEPARYLKHPWVAARQPRENA